MSLLSRRNPGMDADAARGELVPALAREAVGRARRKASVCSPAPRTVRDLRESRLPFRMAAPVAQPLGPGF